MARNRSILFKKRNKRKAALDIDITSLLDILVILLVFLLRSYNSSGVTVNVPQGIELPKSTSQSINNPGVMIQVSKDKIWVDSETVLSSENADQNVYDHGGRRIIPLFNELIKKKQQIEQVAKTTMNAKSFSGTANLIIDKSIKYNYLKKLMYTCAEAGFKEFKFVVLGED